MFETLNVFQMASDMARHAGKRQAVTARNIANADTPGFQADRTLSFQDAYQRPAGMQMKTTNPLHFGTAPAAQTSLTFVNSGAEPSPNGNAVSLEEEMLNAVDIQREHKRALAIYRHGLTVLRMSLGR